VTNRSILVIRPNGKIETVYSDEIPYDAIGEVAVRRASTVEFDNDRHLWVAKTQSGRILAEGARRADVVAEEIRVLQEEL